MKLKSKIIELIYDVPLGKSNWKEIIDAICQEMFAAIAFMFIIKPDNEPIFIATTPKGESIWKIYEGHYHKIDPWNEILDSDQYQTGNIYSGSAIIQEKTFKNTEYYQDFWRVMGLGETIGGRLATETGIVVQIGIPRHIKTKNYNDDEVQLLRHYCDHIRRAIELEGYIGNSLPQGIYEFGLISKFGLTRAEAQLVLTLFKTNSLKAASLTLNRSCHTARTQLKSIFLKIETNNQLQLLKRLISN